MGEQGKFLEKGVARVASCWFESSELVMWTCVHESGKEVQKGDWETWTAGIVLVACTWRWVRILVICELKHVL